MSGPLPFHHVQGLDRRMRIGLAESLHYLWQQAGSTMDGAGLDIAAALQRIRDQRQRPGLFGRYFDMAFALRAGNPAEAGRLLREICSMAPAAGSTVVIPYTEDALGADMQRYARLLGGDPPFLAPPSAGAWPGFAGGVGEARDLIAVADPELAAEIAGLVTEIVGAEAAAESPRPPFGGASSFMLWGAIFLNLSRHGSALELAEGIVHEAAHQLLFGLAADGPLVLNAPEDLFESPLRRDRRPMDGVFHASFVCARLHHFFGRLEAAQDRRIGAMERRWIGERRRDLAARFAAGSATVSEFGRLSQQGAAVMDAARTHMRDACP